MELASIVVHLVLIATIYLLPSKHMRTLKTIAWMGLLEIIFLNRGRFMLDETEYYYFFYLCDIVNIGLYLACIKELWHTEFCMVSYLMMFYLAVKAPIYAFLWLGIDSQRLAWYPFVRPLNLILMAMFSYILYDAKKGVKHYVH